MARRRRRKAMSVKRKNSTPKTKGDSHEKKLATHIGEWYLRREKQDQLGAEDVTSNVHGGRFQMETDAREAKIKRLVAEYERHGTEFARTEAETDRLNDVMDRLSKKQERFDARGYPSTAKRERIKAESDRIDAEIRRCEAEMHEHLKEQVRLMREMSYVIEEQERSEGRKHGHSDALNHLMMETEATNVMLHIYEENMAILDAKRKRTHEVDASESVGQNSNRLSKWWKSRF